MNGGAEHLPRTGCALGPLLCRHLLPQVLLIVVYFSLNRQAELLNPDLLHANA